MRVLEYKKSLREAIALVDDCLDLINFAFDPKKHPRDKNGRFLPKNSGSATSTLPTIPAPPKIIKNPPKSAPQTNVNLIPAPPSLVINNKSPLIRKSFPIKKQKVPSEIHVKTEGKSLLQKGKIKESVIKIKKDSKNFHSKQIKLNAWDTTTDQKTFGHVAKLRGFDKKPHVVSKQEMDLYEKGGHKIIYRGIAGSQSSKLFEDWKNGDMTYASVYVYGQGTYSTPSSHTASLFAGDDGIVFKMGISKDAKIADYDYIFKKAFALKLDPGIYAAAQGYDIVHVKSAGHYLILNRTAVKVQVDPHEKKPKFKP